VLKVGTITGECDEIERKGRGLKMPSSGETLKERLARYCQIKISVIGRKSGKTISIPVWFVTLRSITRSSMWGLW
jgi:hypothetical protein